MKKSKKVLLTALSLCFVASTATAISATNTVNANDALLSTRLTTKEYIDANFFIDGTSVRIADATHTPAKRHHMVLSNALYQELSALDNVTVGIALIPEALLTDGSLDIADANASFDGVVYDSATSKDGFGVWKKDASKVEGVVSLTNIPDTDFDVNIVSRGFIKIGNDYYYTSQPTARSMSWVARQEYDNANTTLLPEQITSLKDTYLDLGYTVSFDGAEGQSVIYGDNISALAPEVTVDEGYVLKGWYNQSKSNKFDMVKGYAVGNMNLYSVQMQDTFVEDFAESYSKSKNFASANRANVNATATWEETVEGKSGVLATKGETEDNETKIYLSSEYTLADLQEKFNSYDWGGLTINAYIGAQGTYTVNFGLNEEGNALTQTVAGQEWVELNITRNTAKNKGLENTLAVDGTGADALFAVEDLPEDTLVYIDSISFSEKPTTTPAKGVVQSFDGYSAGVRAKTDTVREDTDTVEYLDEWDGRYGVARDIGADKYANFYLGANITYQDFVDDYGLALDASTNTYDIEYLDYISIWIWIEKLDGQADTVKLVNGKVSWTVTRETWYELKMERENFLLSTESAGTAGKYNCTLQQFVQTLSYDTVSQGTQFLFWSDGLVTNETPNTRVYFDEIKFVMHDNSRTIQSFDNATPSVTVKGSLADANGKQYDETWEGRTGVVSALSQTADNYGNFYLASSNTYEELCWKSENLTWNYISIWLWIDYEGSITLTNGYKSTTVVGRVWQEYRMNKDDFCVSENGENGKLRYTLDLFFLYIDSERNSGEYIFYSDALGNGNVRVYFDEMSFIYDDSYIFEDFSATDSYKVNSTSGGKTEVNTTAEWVNVFNGKAGVLKTQGEFFNYTAFNSTTASTKTSFHISSNSLTTAQLAPMIATEETRYDYISVVIYIDKAGEYTVDFATSSATSNSGAQTVQGGQWVELKVNIASVYSTLRYSLSSNDDNANNNNRNRRPLFSIKNLSADTVEGLPASPDVWVYIDEIRFCNYA